MWPAVCSSRLIQPSEQQIAAATALLAVTARETSLFTILKIWILSSPNLPYYLEPFSPTTICCFTFGNCLPIPVLLQRLMESTFPTRESYCAPTHKGFTWNCSIFVQAQTDPKAETQTLRQGCVKKGKSSTWTWWSWKLFDSLILHM